MPNTPLSSLSPSQVVQGCLCILSGASTTSASTTSMFITSGLAVSTLVAPKGVSTSPLVVASAAKSVSVIASGGKASSTTTRSIRKKPSKRPNSSPGKSISTRTLHSPSTISESTSAVTDKATYTSSSQAESTEPNTDSVTVAGAETSRETTTYATIQQTVQTTDRGQATTTQTANEAPTTPPWGERICYNDFGTDLVAATSLKGTGNIKGVFNQVYSTIGHTGSVFVKAPSAISTYWRAASESAGAVASSCADWVAKQNFNHGEKPGFNIMLEGSRPDKAYWYCFAYPLNKLKGNSFDLEESDTLQCSFMWDSVAQIGSEMCSNDLAEKKTMTVEATIDGVGVMTKTFTQGYSSFGPSPSYISLAAQPTFTIMPAIIPADRAASSCADFAVSKAPSRASNAGWNLYLVDHELERRSNWRCEFYDPAVLESYTLNKYPPEHDSFDCSFVYTAIGDEEPESIPEKKMDPCERGLDTFTVSEKTFNLHCGAYYLLQAQEIGSSFSINTFDDCMKWCATTESCGTVTWHIDKICYLYPAAEGGATGGFPGWHYAVKQT
ncbi:hypothetical protein ANO11243_067040 [Dothideomycetidae sp. 11243]|nr:hypothetical protein ANO11243_067040 [fungal sp. No.11243]